MYAIYADYGDRVAIVAFAGDDDTAYRYAAAEMDRLKPGRWGQIPDSCYLTSADNRMSTYWKPIAEGWTS